MIFFNRCIYSTANCLFSFILEEFHFASQEVAPLSRTTIKIASRLLWHFVPVDIIDIVTKRDKDLRLIISLHGGSILLS